MRSPLSLERPPVVDSLDILNDPARCFGSSAALDVPWYEGAMTHWKEGSRPTDGVWASHWYGAVSHQRSFHHRPRRHTARCADRALAADMMVHYEAMAAFKLS